MDPKTVKDSQVQLSQAMDQGDANLLNFVHGGVIMRLVDTAAALAAQKHSGGPVVTAAIDEMSFIEPVNLGDLVTLRASVNYAGTTSMEVGVRVETENVLSGRRAHTSTAYLVFVGLDPNTGQKRQIPPLVAETPDEHRRLREALVRREARLARREAILKERSRLES